MTKETYRNCTIEFDPKPIGDRNHDWEWSHKHYEGPTETDEPELFGTAGSMKECYSQIDEMYLDLSEYNDEGEMLKYDYEGINNV